VGLLLIAAFTRSIASCSSSLTDLSHQDSQSLAQLFPDKPQERKLAGGEVHLYEITLPAQHFLRLTLDQLGIDVALTFFDQRGRKIIEADHRHGERGQEKVSLIRDVAGVYRLEVRSIRKTDPGGSYQITLALPPITEADQTSSKAEQLAADAQSLLARPTRESATGAIAKCQEARALFELTNNLQMKAVVLNLIGRSHYFLGDHKQSVEFHHQALELTRASGDQYEEAETLADLSQTYRAQSENQKALEYANQAVSLWQLLRDRRGECEALITAGRVSFALADQHKALFYYEQALKVSQSLADASLELSTLSATALSYYVLGDNEEAADHWKQALALAIKTGNRGMEINALGKLGAVYGALSDQQSALTYLNRAIELARAGGDKIEEAGSLQTIGRLYRSTGDPRKSIASLNQSLMVLKGVNNPPSFARAHYNLGKAYTDLGDYERAVDYLNQALVVWKSRSDSINIASTIRELARAERGRGNLQTALMQSQTAVNLIEWLRTRAGGQEQRAAYLASVQDYFELQIDVLTRLHRLDPSRNYVAEALQTSERARARSLLEAMSEAGIDIRRGVSPELLQRERTITEQLSNKATERAHLAGLEPLPTALVKLDQEIKELTVQYDKVATQIRAASPAYGQLLPPQPLSLAEIREQVIDADTLLLEYYLGSDRSYVWAVTSTSINVYELPKRAVIESSARQAYGLLTARNRRVRFETTEERAARVARADVDTSAAARALSDTVLGPVAALLTRKRMLVVSDGALQYVPFAALPKPGASGYEPLTVTSEVVSLPSASTLALLRREIAKRQPAPKTITVLADPVFNSDDERVKAALARNRPATSRSVAVNQRSTILKNEIKRAASESGWESDALRMARLPFTRREAEVVASLVPAAARSEQLDFDANLANAIKGDLSQYRIVHFATHGFLNSRHPELSGIVLSLIDERAEEQDGFLRAHQIYDLKLPADLVVLSGCRTGLGKEIRGEGLIGLTRAFMHAGSARVLVSLWDVNDEATSELMRRFYAGLLGPEKLSPAAALRAAQISMSADKRWSSPYYWAGFILQGEPR
jgi:CHAT domain-containing protein